MSAPARSDAAVVTRATENGLSVVALENARVRIAIWPDHGADILSFTHRPSGVDALWKNPRNQPPRSTALSLPHRGRSEFYDTFHGGWIYSLPNGFFAGDYFGAPLGTLGEFAQLPWRVTTADVVNGDAVVTLTAAGVRTPFDVRRAFTLPRDSAIVRVATSIRNQSSRRLPVACIEHLTLGGPLLDGGRIFCSARRLEVPGTDRPELGQLKPGFSGPWPQVPESNGAWRDCRVIPGRGATTEHVVLLHDFKSAAGGIWHERLQLGFCLQWDAAVMPLAWLWATGSGGEGYPLWGSAHVVGFEPATSPMRPFDELLARNEVAWIEPHGELRHEVRAGFIGALPPEFS